MAEFSEQSLPRRSFLRGQFFKSLQTEQVKQQGHNAIRPPWANLVNFYEKCTACNACINACEMQILKKGAGGFPEVDFSLGRKECSFCQACVNVCEHSVFRPTGEVAWTHKIEIGTACLTQMGVECRACEDNCEQRAIRFKRVPSGISMPTLNLENCNGCGACLGSCPTGAITILKEEGVNGTE